MKNKKILAVILASIISIANGSDSEDFDRYDIPYKKEKKLVVDIDFAFGSLNIRPSTNDKYIMRAGMNFSNQKFKPSIVYKKLASKGKLALGTVKKNHSLSLKEFNKIKGNNNTNEWRLEFIKKIPTTYDIEFGAGDGNLNFSGMTIDNMSLELAMGDVEILFDEPNQRKMKSMNIETGLGNFEARGLGYANINDFSLECGLGSSLLIFDGKFKGILKADISVGLGSVDIEIPRGVAVEIRSESSFLSSVSFDDFEKIDSGLYRSSNWDTHPKTKMIIEISVGMGSANVRWID